MQIIVISFSSMLGLKMFSIFRDKFKERNFNLKKMSSNRRKLKALQVFDGVKSCSSENHAKENKVKDSQDNENMHETETSTSGHTKSKRSQRKRFPALPTNPILSKIKEEKENNESIQRTETSKKTSQLNKPLRRKRQCKTKFCCFSKPSLSSSGYTDSSAELNSTAGCSYSSKFKSRRETHFSNEGDIPNVNASLNNETVSLKIETDQDCECYENKTENLPKILECKSNILNEDSTNSFQKCDVSEIQNNLDSKINMKSLEEINILKLEYLIKDEEPPESYWKEVAEKNIAALNHVQYENAKLKDEIEVLNTEIHILEDCVRAGEEMINEFQKRFPDS